MRSLYIITLCLTILTGCNKSDASDDAVPVAVTVAKVDLKELTPGMTLVSIEKITGKLTCQPTTNLLQRAETEIADADKYLEKLKAAPPDATQTRFTSEETDKAKKTAAMRNGTLDFKREVFRNLIDIECVATMDAGFLFANLPTAVQIFFKQGHAEHILLHVEHGESEQVLAGLGKKLGILDKNNKAVSFG